MGEYKMEEERVNEYPLYKKAKEDHYIYRGEGGEWAVTDSRADVDEGGCSIMTQEPAQLPTSEGVTWQYWDGEKEEDVPDDAISAIDVKGKILMALANNGGHTACVALLEEAMNKAREKSARGGFERH
mmetsp:Transcript_9816/g.25224  ORF Transcript_9816/g.25224 Transcript_9816/m.25224 type:complete len:128 (-) Transcript_9816:13-396(-)